MRVADMLAADICAGMRFAAMPAADLCALVIRHENLGTQWEALRQIGAGCF
jgi:hypothetical protein